jgi:hypothetical protein
MHFQGKNTLKSNYYYTSKHPLKACACSRMVEVVFKVFFTWKYIKIIFLFLILIKKYKKINLKLNKH